MRILITLSILLMAQFSQAQLSNDLYIKGIQTAPKSNVDEYIKTATLGQNDIVQGRYYKVLQFENILTKTEVAALEKEGIKILDYIPNKAYFVSIPQGFYPDKLKALKTRYIQEWGMTQKLDESLLDTYIPDWAMDGATKIKVNISYPKDLKQKTVLELCAAEGIIAKEYNGINSTFTASIDKSKLYDYAQLPYIIHIEMVAAPPVAEDTPGRALNRANLIDSPSPMGRKYNGEGVAVLCRDDGAVFPHADFQGRLFQDYNTLDPRNHGDGVSGIMAGAGNINPKNRGMAAAADLYVIDYQANFLDNTMQLHRNQDVLVTNSSYSNGCNAGYIASARTVDDQCYDNKSLMHVFSAGNSNFQDCDYGAGEEWGNITGGHKQGKNVIAVANTTNTGVITESSSRGPAYDGRIKPDISANGIDHISTDNDHTYMQFGGTSAAAPCVAGIMAMLHDAYSENNNGETADAAVLKALLLNTADDVGNPGPDFIYGWGIANAYRAALAIENTSYETAIINQNEQKTHTITIPDGVKELRIMTYWRDPAAFVNASSALVNDMDTEVTGPDGSTHLPWELNPFPTEAVLNFPAQKGRDNINNMEQVHIENPVAGEYILNIDGHTIPTTDHEYIVTWEIRTDDISFVYPSTGDKLVATDSETIYWEGISTGEEQLLSFSSDGGSTWTELSRVNANVNNFRYNVPNLMTGEALFKIDRGNEEFISEPFTITPRPTNVEINEVCESEIRLSWSSVVDAVSYDVYVLGEKYMEVLVTTDITSVAVSIDNPFKEQWVAVSANFENGVKGQRTIAEFHDGTGLKNCTQDYDLSLNQVLNPTNENFITCTAQDEQQISIEIINEGINPLNEITAAYQLDNGSIVEEAVGQSLAPGDTLLYTFSQPIVFTQSGEFSLKTWVSDPQQTFFFNDSTLIEGPVYIDQGLNAPIEESFSEVDVPLYWRTENPDSLITWIPSTTTQKNGIRGGTMLIALENYFSSSRGQQDYLYLPPLDLSQETASTLIEFDHSYYYNQTSNDGFMIEVSTDCGETFQDTIYSKFGAELGTTLTPYMDPENFGDWTTEQIDLSSYNGLDKVIIRFTSVNDRGANLYLDNINIKSIDLEAPVADFLTNADEACVLEQIGLEHFATGGLLKYEWNFGLSAFPPTSDQPGPHQVTYVIPGEKTVTLTVSNDEGSATITKTINVINRPSGGWSSQNLGSGNIQFTSNITNPGSYFWDFGDGDFSTQANPIHNYATSGNYTVNLRSSNACGSSNASSAVSVVISSTSELEQSLTAAIAPNPNQGQFSLLLNGKGGDAINMKIVNISGQLIHSESIQLTGAEQIIKYDQQLKPGIYLLELSSELGVKTLKMSVVN